ncbi:phage integrase SAM-like domain-containing protein, partial [Bacteroides heparinolyticus]
MPVVEQDTVRWRAFFLSTADNYRTAVRSFVRFNGGRDVPLSALDAETLRRYERWLREGGVCPNTSSCYLRSLRAI